MEGEREGRRGGELGDVQLLYWAAGFESAL